MSGVGLAGFWFFWLYVRGVVGVWTALAECVCKRLGSSFFYFVLSDGCIREYETSSLFIYIYMKAPQPATSTTLAARRIHRKLRAVHPE
jgi:hypothetical protein